MRNIVRALPVLLLLLLAPVLARAQEPAVITGRVTNTAGQPEAGVLVRIEALNVGAMTAADGAYRLTIPGARIRGTMSVNITASRVGMTSVRRPLNVTAGAQLTQDFVLAPQVLMLEELVVTGHATPASRARVPFSVSAVAVENIPVSAGGVIQGKVAGARIADAPMNTEEYNHIQENVFLAAARDPLSTFSIDVDRASYSNVRRFIRDGQAPPADAVRIEEMVNYFTYAYPAPRGEHPFGVVTEVGDCPWNRRHQLVQVALQGRMPETRNLPPSNLVFLVDVSGSMSSPDKLPLVQESLRLLVGELTARDRIALVVYAGAAGLVLDATPGDRKDVILAAIDRLSAGGSTAGAAGIQLAYDVARRNHMPGGNNRVILASDGDFNVGVSSEGELVRLIEEKRDQGTFLTVLGFGRGNLADARMEQLADKGNGNYAYVDEIAEARRVLVSERAGTLFTLAKDVKLQVEFNPARVYAYRLIGYENRMLAAQDFNDDRKDAGEMGAGHTVTALYEIVPVGADSDVQMGGVDSLRYQRVGMEPVGRFGREMMNVKVRYKLPDGEQSRLLSHAVQARDGGARSSENFRFAAAVAEFGMLLRTSEHRGRSSVDDVLRLARGATGPDADGYRTEFVRMVEAYAALPRRPSAASGGDGDR
ncbi:Ca-activated chloride channel family protein [Longimicrobium terrae]|uniref:Ca-activated chloride channel family protein n=1 Tax=Longimicrobium terrae TaxID=1639882 RepID=A0A841H0E6_9BACT|nr:Ca-activated chloride channel family protein [Longimicrobium terrae]